MLSRSVVKRGASRRWLIAALLAFTVSSCGGESADSVTVTAPMGQASTATTDASTATTDGAGSVVSVTYENGARLLLASDGSLLFESPSPSSSAVRQDRTTGAIQGRSSVGDRVIENTGIPLVGPDAAPLRASYEHLANPAAAVVGAAAAGQASESSTAGRPTWTWTASGNSAGVRTAPGGFRVEAVADQETGVLVRRTATVDGATYDETVARSITVEPHAEIPALTATNVVRGTPGPFMIVDLKGMAAAVPYAPVTASLPGFRLSFLQVATGRTFVVGLHAQRGSDWPAENPTSSNVALMEYRDGFRSFVVTMRSVGASGPDAWRDPYTTYDPDPVRESYTPAAGWGRGHRFEIVTGPDTVPHAWAVVGDVVVTVGGDLSTAQLKSVLDSLRVAG